MLINHYIKRAVDIIPVKTPVNRKDNIPNLMKNIQLNINSSKRNRNIFEEWTKEGKLENTLHELVSVENICIIPICGYASRIGNVPKFMLPIENDNSLIKNTVCCIYKVEIPLCEAGVQLICKTLYDSVHHIVLQKKYQKVCNNYFKLRHFNELLQEKIRQWFCQQAWYIPNGYSISDLLKKLFDSNFCKIAYKWNMWVSNW